MHDVGECAVRREIDTVPGQLFIGEVAEATPSAPAASRRASRNRRGSLPRRTCRGSTRNDSLGPVWSPSGRCRRRAAGSRSASKGRGLGPCRLTFPSSSGPSVSSGQRAHDLESVGEPRRVGQDAVRQAAGDEVAQHRRIETVPGGEGVGGGFVEQQVETSRRIVDEAVEGDAQRRGVAHPVDAGVGSVRSRHPVHHCVSERRRETPGTEQPTDRHVRHRELDDLRCELVVSLHPVRHVVREVGQFEFRWVRRETHRRPTPCVRASRVGRTTPHAVRGDRKLVPPPASKVVGERIAECRQRPQTERPGWLLRQWTIGALRSMSRSAGIQ